MLTVPELAAAEAAHKALEGNLFVSGWALESVLRSIMKINVGKIVLGEVAGHPVGVAVIWNHQVMVYVSPDYRLQGIGSKLVETLKSRFSGLEVKAGYGVKGSTAFWQKLGVTVSV